ncbi:MAG: 4-hydroxybenzoyl-CoA thioesterase [Thiotrichales bacterium SG8_50]|nr:MAG: 4-hydroxybenzoyl-CoA thioesterase [Thiotrichales bacterium SG8_50]
MSVYSIPVRVYYEDTDAGGVVYYANYLRFMERARTEWLRHLGFEQDELSLREGVVFAVRSASIEFIKAARFNEQLQVTVELVKYGKASVNFEQQIQRNNELICSGEIRLACVDAESFKPKAIPAAIMEKFRIANGQL